MTVNLRVTPNSVHLTGDTTMHHHFGAMDYVKARPLGVHPHIDVRFNDGEVRWELSPDTAVQLQRELLLALAEFPVLPCIHDAIGGEEVQ